MSEPKKRDTHKDQTIFQVWMPRKFYDRWIDYLQRISYGETTADQFKMLVYHLLELDAKSQTIVNPRADRKKELIRQNRLYGLEETEICLRNKPRTGIHPDAIAQQCFECKVMFRSSYQSCQELKKERREALK